INLHLLRKHRTAVRTADEVSANRDVEDDKERCLKLGRRVYSARDVCLRILDPIDVPPDRGSRARDRKRVETRRERTRRVELSTKRDVLSILVGPMDRAEVSERALALNLH